MKMKKIIISCLAFMMCLSVVNGASSMQSLSAIETSKEYEIYPKPHDIAYTGTEYVIRNGVNIVYDSTIDQPTKNRLEEILAIKEKEVTVSNAKVEGKTNILVGTYGSNEYVDTYANANYAIDATIFNKMDSNYVISNDGEIIILGKHTDGSFFGVTSLKHIFNQMEGSTIKNFVIKDYADTKTRGFIEGYYGIPWTNEDRKSLMKFGGDFKMTSYIFAPKDDPYHSGKWREPYPADKLAEISEMAAVGNDTKCKFVWTIHPFMNGGITEATYDVDIQKIKAKFEQLYTAGVRQFGVLGDDAGSLPRSVVIRVMADLQEWVESKNDVYNLVFCPGGYNNAWWAAGELSEYDKGFHEDIQIFWTGNSVCAPIIQDTLDKFKTRDLPAGDEPRRSPLFWLNWPVNDINMSRLMMGKGSLLHTDINIDDLSGVVTNPMQDAEPSKVALFAIADYAWNVKGFDDDQSWKDSFKYIDKDAGDSLYTIAKHVSDPAPNGHGLVLEESEELKPLLDDFKSKYASGKSILVEGQVLVKEMDEIIAACDDFINTTKNDRMKEQILPFSNSLKDLATAIKGFVEAAMAIENDNKALAWDKYSTASAKFEASKNHDRPTISGTKKAIPGSKRLVPFATDIAKKVEPIVNEYLDLGGDKELEVTASSSYSKIHSGNITDILDGNKDTSVWFGDYEAAGRHITLSFNKPMAITGINVSAGTTSNADTFGTAKFQYTLDGESWVDVSGDTYGPYQKEASITGLELKDVVGLRYVCTAVGAGNKWVALREFGFTTTEDTSPLNPAIIKTDKWSYYSGNSSVASLLDDDQNTMVWCDTRNEAPTDTVVVGDYFGLDLGREITLGKINIDLGKDTAGTDRLKNFDLQYSSDNLNYTTYKSYADPLTISEDLSKDGIKARYIRLVAKNEYKSWVAFRTFRVSQSKFLHSAYTNSNALLEHGASYGDNMASIPAGEDITLKNNEYLGLKLDRIHDIKSLDIAVSNSNLKIETSQNEEEWVNAVLGMGKPKPERYIRILNDSGGDITFNLTNFEVHTEEFYPRNIITQTFGSIAEGNVQNLFDNSRSTGLKYQATQRTGQHFIADIGQEIDLKDLKVVVHDSDKDYIRDGKVYASISKDGPWTGIITIGDQIANTESNDTTINDSYPIHDVSYNVAQNTEIDMRARYIKVEVTQPYSHRWSKINEIEINNGEYIPEVNDARFEATVQEVRGGMPANMLDGDLTTMYIPSEANASITYKISDSNELNSLKIIQSAGAISNARVSIRSNTTKAKSSWVDVGVLNQSINEFTLPDNSKIYEVKITWGDIIPNIIELSTSKTATVSIDKTELSALLNENVVTTKWTSGSVAVYENALVLGQEAKGNAFASQNTVDTAVQNITLAKDSAKDKGDATKLKEEVANEYTESATYTAKSWTTYQKVLQVAKIKLADEDNLSKEDIDTLLANIVTGKAGLAFNPTNKEIAIIEVEDARVFIDNVIAPESIYTVASWDSYVTAFANVQKMIEDDKVTAIKPAEFKKVTDKLTTAKATLVNVTALVNAIKDFDDLQNKDHYKASTLKAYEDAVNSSKALLQNGTTQTITDAIDDILVAKGKLEFVDGNNVQEYVDSIKSASKEAYTAKSYDSLMAIIQDVEEKLLMSPSVDDLVALKNKLLTSYNALVDVRALTMKIAEANRLDNTNYTTSSVAKLIKALEDANKELIDGTVTSVTKAIDGIQTNITGLTRRVDFATVQDYFESIVSLDLTKYSDTSVKTYQEALNVLIDILDNLEDTSAVDFLNAKDAFEKAESALVLKVVQDTENKPSMDNNGNVETGDSTQVIGYVVLCITMLGVVIFWRLQSKRKGNK